MTTKNLLRSAFRHMLTIAQRSRVGFLAAIAVTIVTAQSARAEHITVFAAASLKGALDEVSLSYEAQTGHQVSLSYAGSSILARQITLGAPADLFISANPDWMDVVEASDHVVTASRIDLLGNSLVVIAPTSTPSPANLDDLAGYLSGRKIAMGLVNAVPAGIYGKAALEHLGQWDAVAPLVAQTDNVRAALALVALEQVPLGIVYGSDAKAEPRVVVLKTFDPNSHPKIIYPAAVIRGENEAPAEAFLLWMTGPAATQIFQQHGFDPLEGS